MRGRRGLSASRAARSRRRTPPPASAVALSRPHNSDNSLGSQATCPAVPLVRTYRRLVRHPARPHAQEGRGEPDRDHDLVPPGRPGPAHRVAGRDRHCRRSHLGGVVRQQRRQRRAFLPRPGGDPRVEYADARSLPGALRGPVLAGRLRRRCDPHQHRRDAGRRLAGPGRANAPGASRIGLRSSRRRRCSGRRRPPGPRGRRHRGPSRARPGTGGWCRAAGRGWRVRGPPGPGRRSW